MEKSRLKNESKNNLENFNLNREIDIIHGNLNLSKCSLYLSSFSEG